MRVEKQRRSREKRGYGTASRRKVPNRAARQRHCGAWYRAAMAKRDSALRRKAKARLSNAMRWHSNELRHEAQKGKKQRMKATWLDKERGIYRIGDEHGDFIDDELHPIQRVCSPPLADRTIERRIQRKRKRKENGR